MLLPNNYEVLRLLTPQISIMVSLTHPKWVHFWPYQSNLASSSPGCPQCKRTKTIREGSFFCKSRIATEEVGTSPALLVRQYPVKDAAEEAQICMGKVDYLN